MLNEKNNNKALEPGGIQIRLGKMGWHRNKT